MKVGRSMAKKKKKNLKKKNTKINKKKNTKKITKKNTQKKNTNIKQNTQKKNSNKKNTEQKKETTKQNTQKKNLNKKNIEQKKETKKQINNNIKEIKIEKVKHAKKEQKTTKKIKINIFFIYFITIMFLEIIFRIFCTETIFPISFLYTILYSCVISLFLSIISSLFNEKTNNILSKIIIFILSIWYITNIIYKLKMDVFFSINSLGLANQLTSFLGDTFSTIGKHFTKLLIILIPFILSFIYKKRITYIEKNKKNIIKYILIFIISTIIFYASLFINKNKEYSMYKLYFKVSNNSLVTEKTGVLISTTLELKEKIFKYKDNNLAITTKSKEETIEETKYNVLDIDFDELSENTTNQTLKQMNEYFKNDTPTKQNEYTGKYKGKNLILFMAESFNSIGVSKELTPTLYKLTNEGFVFENFYSPVILSTIGGEFQELTGLYPHINLLGNVWRRGTNYFEYGYGNIFKKANYKTYAYHNNQYNFQNRNNYLNAIGFDNYQGCNNGLEQKINCKIWPQSDSEMITATIDDYINNEEPFMTYYVTVSGHMAYNWGNAMSKKHKDKVEHLNYPTNIKAYIATQIELDEALNTLITKLEEAGKLDDTVIALVGDHYPYDLEISEINQFSTYERDSIIEVNHSNFILWNNKTETTKIKKIGSQIDVLPTILNIFGLEYDSRLIIGKDILADNEGLAIFSNNSWVSDKGKYYSSTNKFEPFEGVTVEDNYVSNMNAIVNNKILMSKYIIQENYYDYIFKEQQ